MDGERVPVETTVIRNSRAGQRVPVLVTVNSEGRVIKATSMIQKDRVKDIAEKGVRSWEFKPFFFNGKPTQVIGFVYFWI
jgi:hypothetical protein